jgi:5-methylcytosine-specific restriction protein B
MPTLAVIPIVRGPMADNLEKSLAEPGDKPWAHDRHLGQMGGLEQGAYVCFVDARSISGGPLGRSGPVPLEAQVRRIVLGVLTRSIDETPTPYFGGFDFQYWYELVADRTLPEGSTLAEATEVLNEHIADLDLTADALREALSNARSAKVGMFEDGEVRRADYYRQRGRTATTATRPAATPPERTPRPVAATPTAETAESFVAAVRQTGLVFAGLNEHLPRAFLAALMAKPFAILTGLSGSGKTQLARALGQWLGPDRYLVQPVRADWTSSEPLLGYEDALRPPARGGQRAWQVPPTLELLLRAADDPTNLYLFVLDEMNLAHVERYFADVLSGIESGEPVLPNLVRSEGVWHLRPGAESLVPLPSNVLVVGTVNVDETTYQFSPKVLDRAFSFEFRVGSDELRADQLAVAAPARATPSNLAAVRQILGDPNWHLNQEEVPGLADELVGLHEELAEIGLEFGHRTFREALRFAAIARACGIEDDDALWDWAVMTKLLPRVHGSRRQLEPFIERLMERAIMTDDEKPPRPLVARKAQRMLDALRANHFAGFSD